MSGLAATRRERRALAADNRKEPKALRRVPQAEWPNSGPRGLTEVWRSREFLVQIFSHEAAVRMTVCRTEVSGDRWRDGITWDEMQRLKGECGFSRVCAVEVFPPDDLIVNDANMRHLWLLHEPPPFMWGREANSPPEAPKEQD